MGPIWRYSGTQNAGHSAWDNLRLIPPDAMPKLRPLGEDDRSVLLEGLDGILPPLWQDKIWEMIYRRW